MLEFYFDFLRTYIPLSKWELVNMDTDSLYVAFADLAEDEQELDRLVYPNLKDEYEREKNKWLVPNPDPDLLIREPGLFKLEWTGTGMIALCAKCKFTGVFYF